MKLAQVLATFPQVQWGRGNPNAEVTGLTFDSRRVQPGFVFVAVRGTGADGHQFLPQVAAEGALALVVEDRTGVPADFAGAVVQVDNSREALSKLGQQYWRHPAQQLYCVGITGTNGKTTITYMVETIFSAHGWPTGVMGTIDHHLGKTRWPSALTTPDPLTLQQRLREFVDHGARAAAFEVSSHALHQARVDGVSFSAGVFTNFTRDHLDYHHDMDDYFSSKQKLFLERLAPGAVAILNGDDPWVRRVRVRDGVTTWWFGQEATANFKFQILQSELSGHRFHLQTPRGAVEVELPCPGLHNVYNAVAALAVGVAAGVPLEVGARALSRFYGAPGRLERVPVEGRVVFVDYAHTDDALRVVLRALREAMGKDAGRLICVFGCGGDRDRGKRPLMGKAAAEGSEMIILTSDNPRSENPQEILKAIHEGIPSTFSGEVIEQVDRRQAIAEALQRAREGDVILIAGKGHENYQIVGGRRLTFSDQEVVRELVNRNAK